ncbi:MAG: ribose 5-phosphate isomerase B [candidate division FCPU426 bacterium]
MKVSIATDHAGFSFKEELKKFLESQGHQVKDHGAHDATPSDYPDFALALGTAVVAGESEAGILVCGAGHGMAIAANKIPGIRAATCGDEYATRMARSHNDANVLVLPARVIAQQRGRELATLFLQTPFEGGRHAARLEKITRIEEKISK